MIRNETEYQKVSRRIEEEKTRLAEHRARLEQLGLGEAEIDRALQPLQAFHEQLIEEKKSYERLKAGLFDEILNLRGVGRTLVALRIAKAC